MKYFPLVVSVLTALCTASLHAAEVDFARDIQPILEKSCIQCHGPEKQKGKLRMDTKEAALKGGSEGAVIEPGDAAKSDLYRRITLPKDHDDVMPNEGDPLSESQTNLIRDWINQGAVWPEGLVLKSSAAPQTAKVALPADFKPGPNEAKAIASLAKAGVEVRPIAMNLVWREANCRMQGTNVTDAVVAFFKDVPTLVDLNLATTKVTDAGLESLNGLTNLMKLHLELTQITDAGLKHLRGLTNLVYLNLYGTAVSDAALENLKSLPHLKNLYVWQSKVTEAGVKDLKAALPGVDVSTGWDLKDLAVQEKKPEEKEEEKKKR
jgi:hypothetical protein